MGGEFLFGGGIGGGVFGVHVAEEKGNSFFEEGQGLFSVGHLAEGHIFGVSLVWREGNTSFFFFFLIIIIIFFFFWIW